MPESTENLILEHLRAIRRELSEHGDRLSRIELRLSTVEQMLGNIYALTGSDRETAVDLANRIRRIERRLELTDE
jgi:broad-specificity NMP kinase